ILSEIVSRPGGAFEERLQQTSLLQSLPGVRETGAHLRAPRLGEIIHDIVDPARLDFRNGYELPTTGPAAFLARNALSVGFECVDRHADHRVREGLSDRQQLQQAGRSFWNRHL